MNLDIDKERLEFLDFAPAPLPGYWCERQEREFAVWCAAKARATPLAPTPAAAEGQAERHIQVLTAERDQARAQYDHVFKVMMSVFNLAPNGKDIHLPDGRVMRFNDPNAAETLNALGRAIWAIPEKLAAAPLPRQAAVQGEHATHAPTSEPVRWEWRHRLIKDKGWGAWAQISKGRYDRRTDYPNSEFRQLSAIPTAPQTAPDQAKSAPATTEKD